MKTADELRQVPLAEAGGTPVIDRVFPRYNSLGTEEAEAVQKVMETGVLSQFLGCWHEDFYGGSKVREFETQCQEYFGVKHAITVNSWTSGLIAAVGALDIEPGDEIIVSPWTMCASATAILQWNAIPVFADIDPHTFNLDPESVRANITEKTRVVVTNDDALAERVRLIRNHAEAVLNDREEMPLNNMLGYNFRLGEIECAIGIEQLKKLPALVASRQHLAERLAEGIRDLPGLQVPVVGEGNTHVYYVFPLLVDPLITGCSKEELAAALKAEGVELATRYQNLHLLPMYQKKMAYGSTGFPWSAEFSRQSVSYDKGICPVAEVMNDSTYLGFGMCVYDLNEADIDLIIQAFRKVWAHKVAAV